MIQANSRGRIVEDVGPFRTMLLQESSSPWTNFAVPFSDEFTAESVENLEGHFRKYDRDPRLEILVDLWPALPQMLLDVSFSIEARMPIMVVAKEDYKGGDCKEARLARSADDLEHVSMIEAEAFQQPYERDQDRLRRRLRKVEDGSLIVAIVEAEGIPAASAMLTVEGDVAELVAVATRAAYRRMGYSRAVCSLLLSRFFTNRGRVAWLSTLEPKLYSGLGFTAFGEQINMIKPRAIS